MHRVEAGHRIRLVLASTDAAYKNAYAVQPVTVRANPLAPGRSPCPSRTDQSWAGPRGVGGPGWVGWSQVGTAERTQSTISVVVAPG